MLAQPVPVLGENPHGLIGAGKEDTAIEAHVSGRSLEELHELSLIFGWGAPEIALDVSGKPGNANLVIDNVDRHAVFG